VLLLYVRKDQLSVCLVNQKVCKLYWERENVDDCGYIRTWYILFSAKLELEKQIHKKELDELKCKHEEEMFTLKKDQYVLNAKVWKSVYSEHYILYFSFLQFYLLGKYVY